MTYRIEFDEATRYNTVVRVRDARVFATFAEANCAAHQVNRCGAVSDVTIVEMGDPEPDPPAPARAAFDVPGTVTIASLKPTKGETPAQRLHRLASLALMQGCQVVWPEGTGPVGRVGVTSGTRANVTYVVDLDRGECSCEGFRGHGYCKHQSYVWALTCGLPSPEPPAGYVRREDAVPVPMGDVLAIAA